MNIQVLMGHCSFCSWQERFVELISFCYLIVLLLLRLCFDTVIHGDASCQYNYDTPLYPFGARTHSHALGNTAFLYSIECV